MSEELEIFLEDCDDQLQMMENALVDMQSNGATEDSIGAIFRAVHTIKGSAGMFGFDDIVAFTHIGENLFDSIRQGDVAINEDMIDLFLLCKDHIDKLIEVLADEEEIGEGQRDIGEDLIKCLNAYLADEAEEIAQNSSEDSPLESEIEIISLDTSSQDIGIKWHISIRLEKEFFTTGMSISSILNFLNKIGKILINCPILYKIPPLQDLDPLIPYIGFELRIQTQASYEEIEDVFEFIANDVNLIIFEEGKENALASLVQQREEEGLIKELIFANLAQENDFKEDLNPVEKFTELSQDTSIVNELAVVSKKKSSSTLRVDSAKIDILINYMSEMVIANSKILSLVESEEDEEKEENSELEEAAQHMKELLELVRDGIMDIRMVQVGESFNKFRRIVSDTSKKIGKDIEFVITGGETELDKTVVERISDPLVHMLRNSIDHGIESPQERLEKGKPEQGRVDLRAYPDAGTIVIEIEDDGKGLDKDRILAKAIENGQVKEGESLSDGEIYKLIFVAGLSTAEEVSAISGRGVGMDVVKRNIEDLRGTIDISSTQGKGSKITIRLPLTLAIIDGFLVQIGNTKFIIPLESIQECIELTAEEHDEMAGNEFINLRGEMLPLLDVRNLLKESPSHSDRQNIVIVYFGNKMVGLLVDELLGEHQTVIKSLGDVFKHLPVISGGSILGSGEIALIFDIARLIEYKK
ncbi:MAG: chemotaxis protein CheA [Arcobacter sp.]|nr:MAG: chemotaxis protein CheA [Arcobacter sp.]